VKVHKLNTEEYPTFFESIGFNNGDKDEDFGPELSGDNEFDATVLAEKYSHIIQNLILFERESESVNNIDLLIKMLSLAVRRIVPTKSTDIFFFTENKGELKAISSEFDQELYKVSNRFHKEGILSVVFNTKSPNIFPDLDNYTSEGAEINFIVFPIIRDNVDKGIFILKSTISRGNYSEIDKRMIQILLNASITKIEKIIYKDKLNSAYEELQVYQGKLSNDFRLSAIGELTEGILEDISSPLQAIVNLVEVLDVQDTNSVEIMKIKSQVHKIHKTVNRLVRFTNLNQKSVKLMPLNLNKVINDYFNIVKSTLDTANIECVLDLEDKIPSILSHPNYINQILTNLFGIIRKNKEGRSGIIIQTRFRNENIYLRFVSTIKLDEENLKPELNYKIVQSLVKKHEGNFTIKDSFDGGSSIVVEFPLIRKIRG
jgi:K+-sensing histidine kinase KdpD